MFIETDSFAVSAPKHHLRPAKLSPVRFGLQCLVLSIGAAFVVGFAYWSGDWLIALIAGGIASACIYLPIFGWMEFQQEAEIKREANEMMDAHRIATDGFIQRRLDGAQQWLLTERTQDGVLLESVVRERDDLQRKLAPFVSHDRDNKTGRFLKRPRPALQFSPGAQDVAQIQSSDLMPNHPTIEGTAT